MKEAATKKAGILGGLERNRKKLSREKNVWQGNQEAMQRNKKKLSREKKGKAEKSGSDTKK